MGRTSRETTPSSQPKDLLTDWEPIHSGDAEPTTSTSEVSPPLTQIPPPLSSPPTSLNSPRISWDWQLPLEALTLSSIDHRLPLSFLNIYPDILQKFPGPPCEALARWITYIQAVFTQSPGFHPYITHLPSTSIPTNETEGRRVAELLERKLIRITQHLSQFFFADIATVRSYIDSCPAHLIPKPLFIVSTPVPEGKQSIPMQFGVEGFNNGAPNGAKVWQNPTIQRTPSRIRQEKIALQLNISRIKFCRNNFHSNKPEPPRVQPPPPSTSIPQVIAPPFPQRPSTAAPNVRPPQQPQPPAPRPPQMFHVPLMQPPAMQQPSPLPSAPPVHPPPPPPVPRADPIREDIARLEAQVAKLTAILNAKN